MARRGHFTIFGDGYQMLQRVIEAPPARAWTSPRSERQPSKWLVSDSPVNGLVEVTRHHSVDAGFAKAAVPCLTALFHPLCAKLLLFCASCLRR